MIKYRIIKSGISHTDTTQNTRVEIILYADKFEWLDYDTRYVEVTEDNISWVGLIWRRYQVGDTLCLPPKGFRFYFNGEVVDTISVDHDPTFELWEVSGDDGDDKLQYAFYISAPWVKEQN